MQIALLNFLTMRPLLSVPDESMCDQFALVLGRRQKSGSQDQQIAEWWQMALAGSEWGAAKAV